MLNPPRHSSDDVGFPAVVRRWFASLAFWTALFFASGLYAFVSLSPKLLAHLELRASHFENQVRLVALEREVGYLEKVADSLEHDPHFAAELARMSFDAARGAEERIETDPGLNFGSHGFGPMPRLAGGQATPTTDLPYGPSADPAGARTPAWARRWDPYLELAAGDSSFRATALGIAAIVVVFAFTFFQEGRRQPVQARTTNRLWGRYFKRPQV
jgi:hypothetical protein